MIGKGDGEGRGEGCRLLAGTVFASRTLNIPVQHDQKIFGLLKRGSQTDPPVICGNFTSIAPLSVRTLVPLGSVHSCFTMKSSSANRLDY